MFLELRQVNVQYPGRAAPAVASVSLQLRAGEIGVLIGPSGCGKTTLLRAIAGLEPVAAGAVLLSGREVSTPGAQVPPEARRMGMVFQDYALFPHLTVAGNVAYGLTAMRRAEREQRVAEVLTWVGLQASQSQYPHELSGGQQQRVALARALAPRPQLLLLDEPFSNLDVELRERLAHEVRAILKRAGTTALMVTHDQFEAFAVGDQIGVMQAGVLHQWSDAYTLYHRPSSRFVAKFIGHGVLVPARLSQREHGVVVETPLGELSDLAACPLPSAYPRGECDLLLRADDIVHDDAAPVQARIVRKAFRGADFLYTLELTSGHRVVAQVPSHHDHEVGEWIGIRPDLDHVVLFAPEVGGEPAAAAQPQAAAR